MKRMYTKPSGLCIKMAQLTEDERTVLGSIFLFGEYVQPMKIPFLICKSEQDRKEAKAAGATA